MRSHDVHVHSSFFLWDFMTLVCKSQNCIACNKVNTVGCGALLAPPVGTMEAPVFCLALLDDNQYQVPAAPAAPRDSGLSQVVSNCDIDIHYIHIFR